MPIKRRTPRQRYAPIAPYDHGEPIWRPNLAPVAGVLLIAGTLYFAAWPIQTHALVIDLPVFYPYYETVAPGNERSAYTIGVTTEGKPTVDGKIWSPEAFATRLSLWANDSDSILPAIIFEPEPDAPTTAWLPVLGQIKDAGLAQWQFCFGHTEPYRRYETTKFAEPQPGPQNCRPERFTPPLPMPVTYD